MSENQEQHRKWIMFKKANRTKFVDFTGNPWGNNKWEDYEQGTNYCKAKCVTKDGTWYAHAVIDGTSTGSCAAILDDNATTFATGRNSIKNADLVSVTIIPPEHIKIHMSSFYFNASCAQGYWIRNVYYFDDSTQSFKAYKQGYTSYIGGTSDNMSIITEAPIVYTSKIKISTYNMNNKSKTVVARTLKPNAGTLKYY